MGLVKCAPFHHAGLLLEVLPGRLLNLVLPQHPHHVLDNHHLSQRDPFWQVFLWASCPSVCSKAVQTRTESKTGLKVSLHFSRSLLYRFSLFRSLLAGLGLDKHCQTLQTLQQHVFLRFSTLRVVRLLGDILLLLGFEPPLHLLVTHFLGDTGGQLHRAGQSGIGSRRRSGRCSTWSQGGRSRREEDCLAFAHCWVELSSA